MDESKNLDCWIDEIDKAMLDSVEHHKISDVEVGSFLSSGVDSSYVAAVFNGDKTFTVGFDYDKYNEISYAKSLSDKIKIDNYIANWFPVKNIGMLFLKSYIIWMNLLLTLLPLHYIL